MKFWTGSGRSTELMVCGELIVAEALATILDGIGLLTPCGACLEHSLVDDLPSLLRILVNSPKTTAVAVAAITAVYLALGGIAHLIASVIGWLGCVTVLSLIVYIVLRAVCIFVLFPGSMTFVQRGMEFDFGDQMKDHMFEAIHCIESLVHILRTTWPADKVARAERVAREAFRDACHCRDTSLDTLHSALVYARDHESLQSFEGRGAAFLLALQQLLQHFDAYRLPIERALLLDAAQLAEGAPFEQRKAKLFDAAAAAAAAAATDGAEGAVGAAGGGAAVAPAIATAAGSLDIAQLLIFTEGARVAAATLSEPREEKTDRFGTVGKLLRSLWRSRNPFRGVGNLDLLRAELCVRTGGESEWVWAADGAKLDCLFIRADAPGRERGAAAEARSSGSASAAADAGGGAPLHIMILSSPNAGIFEYHHHQCHWIAFYKSLGISVVIWNYRGYGRSTGWPTPASSSRDGEAVLRHFREKYAPAKIGMHGESIGGIVATHVGANARGDPALALDVLVCDRTFGTLEGVAAGLAPKWATRVLRVLTNWRVDNVGNFLATSCYKVCANDPCDMIVKHTCGLTALIAAHVEFGVRFDVGYDSGGLTKAPSAVGWCARWVKRENLSARGALRVLLSLAVSTISLIGNAFRLLFGGVSTIYTASMSVCCALCLRRPSAAGVPAAAAALSPLDSTARDADSVESGFGGAPIEPTSFALELTSVSDRSSAMTLAFEAAVLALVETTSSDNRVPAATQPSPFAGILGESPTAGGVEMLNLSSGAAAAKTAPPPLPPRASPTKHEQAQLETMEQWLMRLDGRCGCTLATALDYSGADAPFGPHALRLFVAELLAWAPLRSVRKTESAPCLQQLRGGSGGSNGWRGQITPQDASRLGTTELKSRLQARGISYTHCIEKGELVALLLAAPWDTPIGTWSASPAVRCGPSTTIAVVHREILRIAASLNAASNPEVGALVDALAAVSDELTRRAALCDSGRGLGYCLPLSCGHNGNYSAREKQALAEHLARAGIATRAATFR